MNNSDEGYTAFRKMFAFVMLIILVLMFARLVIGAVLFLSEEAYSDSSNHSETHYITGSCHEQNPSECCISSCERWCSALGRSATEAGVIDYDETKCSCLCS